MRLSASPAKLDLLNGLGKRDPEAFLGKSPLIDLLSLGIAEQLVAFIGRNSFFLSRFRDKEVLIRWLDGD